MPKQKQHNQKKHKENKGKKPGEFHAWKEKQKRKVEVQERLNLDIKIALESGSIENSFVDVLGFKMELCKEPDYNGYHFHAFVRLKKRGIVFCEVCDKDDGWLMGIYPALADIRGINSIIPKQVAAYVKQHSVTNEFLDATEHRVIKLFPDREKYVGAGVERRWARENAKAESR